MGCLHIGVAMYGSMYRVGARNIIEGVELGVRASYNIETNIDQLVGVEHNVYYDDVVLTYNIDVDIVNGANDVVSVTLRRGDIYRETKDFVIDGANKKIESSINLPSVGRVGSFEYSLLITSKNFTIPPKTRVFVLKYVDKGPDVDKGPAESQLKIVEQPQAMSNVEIGKDLELRVRAELTGSEELIEYLWFSSIGGSNVGGAPIQGANKSTYSVPTGAEGEYEYYVVIRAKVSNDYVSVSSDIAVVHVTVPSSGGEIDNGNGGEGNGDGGEIDIDTGGGVDIGGGDNSVDSNLKSDGNGQHAVLLTVLLIGGGLVVLVLVLILLKMGRASRPRDNYTRGIASHHNYYPGNNLNNNYMHHNYPTSRPNNGYSNPNNEPSNNYPGNYNRYR
jgi:hypothetical protein